MSGVWNIFVEALEWFPCVVTDWFVDCLLEVTLEKLVAFIPYLLGRLHIECLFHGNLTKEVSAFCFFRSICSKAVKFGRRVAVVNNTKTFLCALENWFWFTEHDPLVQNIKQQLTAVRTCTHYGPIFYSIFNFSFPFFVHSFVIVGRIWLRTVSLWWSIPWFPWPEYLNLHWDYHKKHERQTKVKFCVLCVFYCYRKRLAPRISWKRLLKKTAKPSLCYHCS